MNISTWIGLTLASCTLMLGTVFADNGTPAPFDHSHAAYSNVLQKHVVNGIVDYSALLKDRARLDAYIQTMAAVRLQEFQRWGNEEQLAYLINLYNAETLQLIVDNYPVDSIRDIGGFFTKPWDLKVVSLFGKTVTLNTIEHGILRKNYQEPRVHFALVCAARGCPPLRNEAYVPDALYQQLDEQARVFFGTPEKNRVEIADKTVYLSPVLKWYGDDFGATSRRMLDYVSHYFPADAAAALRTQEFSIEYTHYDWDLNDKEH